jgi:hypothetical protein
MEATKFQKVAIIDYWALVRDFNRGDAVQVINTTNGDLSPFTGQVTAVHRGIGFVDVEWPWGNVRHSVEEVVRVNPMRLNHFPPMTDTSYSAWDIAQSRIEDGTSVGYSYANPTDIPKERRVTARFTRNLQKLHVIAAKAWFDRCDEMEAYDRLYKDLGKHFPDTSIKQAISTVYKSAEEWGDRYALYWAAPDRQYKATRGESGCGTFNCPHDKAPLKKSNYKRRGGKSVNLLVCPSCLFVVKQSDIIGHPSHAPHEDHMDVMAGTANNDAEEVLSNFLKNLGASFREGDMGDGIVERNLQETALERANQAWPVRRDLKEAGVA